MKVPSFENWFKDCYGESWQQSCMVPGTPLSVGIERFLDESQKYLTYIAQEVATHATDAGAKHE